MGLFSGSGVLPSLKGVATNVVTLASGQCQLIYPAGWYMVSTGLYTVVQQYDPITGIWRNIGNGDHEGGVKYIYSDGNNYRLANQTGALVGALLTAAGSSYTSAPAVAASAGNSIWRAVVGGAVNTTITVTNGGSGYWYLPNAGFGAGLYPISPGQTGAGVVISTGYVIDLLYR